VPDAFSLVTPAIQANVFDNDGDVNLSRVAPLAMGHSTDRCARINGATM
jgi:hypothetical protein